jgi:hypothetical protein
VAAVALGAVVFKAIADIPRTERAVAAILVRFLTRMPRSWR